MKALVRAIWVGVLGAVVCPDAQLYGEDNDAATRQYNVAVSLQNREAYDLAIDSWGSFLKAHPADQRVTHARHYRGVCYFFTAVGALESKQVDAALKAFDAAEQDFDAVVKAASRFEFLEDTYLYLGLCHFKRAEIEPAGLGAKQYQAAAVAFDTLLKAYPQSKNLAQVFYYRGDCAYHAGQKAEAVQFYSQALTKSPGEKLEPTILYALGVAQEELKDWEQAGKTYDDFLKKYLGHRNASEVIMRRGETLFAAGQFQPAADWLASAASRPDFEFADHATKRQAVALARLGKYGEAGDLLAGIFAKFPNSTRLDEVLDTAHALARGLIRDNKPTEALALVEKMLPHAEGRAAAAALAMDRADATAAVPARRAQSIALYAAVANKFAKDPVAPQALYWAAYYTMAQGDFAGTLPYSEAFLAAYPTHELVPDVRYLAAESCLQLKKFAEAEKLYVELQQKYPQHPDAENWKVRQGTALHLEKKFAEVVALLQPAAGQIKSADARAEACYLIGDSLSEQKQYAAALPQLEAALAAAPHWRLADETLMVLGQAYHHEKNDAKAKETLQKLVAAFPESKVLDRAHYCLGEYATAANEPKTAEAEYRLVAEKWPASSLVPYALQGLGWSLFDQKDFAGAEEAFNTLVEKFPDQRLKLRSVYARGLARHRVGKFAEAAADLQAFLACEGISLGERSDTRYVLGLSLVSEKKYAEAVDVFRKLLAEDAKYAMVDKVYYELAWALKSAGKEKESVDAFADLIKNCPECPFVAEAQFCVGEAAYRDGKFQAAARAYAAALEKAGKGDLGEKAAHKLGWADYRLDSAVDAEQAFNYQCATWPRGPLAGDGTFMLAECLFKQKKLREALAAYERVKDTSSKEFQVLTLLHSAQALDLLALAMLRPDQEGQRKETWEKGLAVIDRVVKEYPDTGYLPEALYERGWALQNLGRFEEATTEYQQVLAKSNAEPGARAQFMIGQIQFQQKKHVDAVKSFLLVLYGYPYPQWQADAAFEAAKCFEALHKKSQAAKQYQELIEKFPQSDKVSAAKSRLESLQRD